MTSKYTILDVAKQQAVKLQPAHNRISLILIWLGNHSDTPHIPKHTEQQITLQKNHNRNLSINE